MTHRTQTHQIPHPNPAPTTTRTRAAARIHQPTVMRLHRRRQTTQRTITTIASQHRSPQLAIHRTVRITTPFAALAVARPGRGCRPWFRYWCWVVHWLHEPSLSVYRRSIFEIGGYCTGGPSLIQMGCVEGPGTIWRKLPFGTRVNNQQPDPTDIYKRVRRAWDTYRLANRARGRPPPRSPPNSSLPAPRESPCTGWPYGSA